MKSEVLNRIINLFQASKLLEAKAACLSVLEENGIDKEPIYLILIEISKIEKEFDLSLRYFDCLIDLFPEEMNYYIQKANFCLSLGKKDEGVRCYERFIARKPQHAVARYNFALYLKQIGEPQCAIDNYLLALDLQIDEPREVFLNIGVVYSELHDTDNALKYYRKALAADKDYVPALYNLGGLYEELGKKEEAIEVYVRILANQPNHISTLSRLVYAQDNLSLKSTEVRRLENYVSAAGSERSVLEDRETAYFALGKVYDEARAYAKAMTYYKKANDLGERRVGSYDPQSETLRTNKLITHFNRSWYLNNRIDNDNAPIFVCGMLRSGSTLVETLLSTHPDIRSGGELNFLHQSIRQVKKTKTLEQLLPSDIRQISDNYIKRVNATFGEHQRVIDKRPDNFQNIGVIKAAFPQAKIICTDRNALDMCLSIYFQQLSPSLKYATKLENIVHFYLEYKKTLRHWLSLFPGDIHVVTYDQLVENPKKICSDLFSYCHLDWDDKYLEFYKSKELVKTASVWQVRKPLKKMSSRSLNYEKEVRELQRMLEISNTIENASPNFN